MIQFCLQYYAHKCAVNEFSFSERTSYSCFQRFFTLNPVHSWYEFFFNVFGAGTIQNWRLFSVQPEVYYRQKNVHQMQNSVSLVSWIHIQFQHSIYIGWFNFGFKATDLPTDLHQNFRMSSLAYFWPTYQIWSMQLMPFLRYRVNKNSRTDGLKICFS